MGTVISKVQGRPYTSMTCKERDSLPDKKVDGTFNKCNALNPDNIYRQILEDNKKKDKGDKTLDKIINYYMNYPKDGNAGDSFCEMENNICIENKIVKVKDCPICKICEVCPEKIFIGLTLKELIIILIFLIVIGCIFFFKKKSISKTYQTF